MQPIPGLDPQPDSTPKRRVVVGVHVQSGGNWRIIIGLIIVGWGLLLTAANLHLDPAYHILAHWYFPCALTAIGLIRLFTADSGVGRGVGGLVTALGAWWLVSETYGIRFDIWDWWPLGLVVLGVLIITRSWGQPGGATLGGSSAAGGFPSATPFPSNPASEASPGVSPGRATDATDAGPVSAFAFWSGVKRRVSAGFKRANIAAFMGGVELDLRPALMVGGQATIEVFVLMGGLEITVPPDWTVANEALVIMGGVDDRSSGSSGATQTLVIKGLILMGGVEIKT
jgi:hypothetical protein